MMYKERNLSFELLRLISMFPFAPTRYSYWFINNFFALIVLQPFLVKLVSVLNKHNQVLFLPIIISLGAILVPVDASALLQTMILSAYTLCVMLICIFIDKIRTWVFVKINITALENKICSSFDYKIRHWANTIG